MKVLKSKGGYLYKEYKNGKKKRISKEEYLKLKGRSTKTKTTKPKSTKSKTKTTKTKSTKSKTKSTRTKSTKQKLVPKRTKKIIQRGGNVILNVFDENGNHQIGRLQIINPNNKDIRNWLVSHVSLWNQEWANLNDPWVKIDEISLALASNKNIEDPYHVLISNDATLRSEVLKTENRKVKVEKNAKLPPGITFLPDKNQTDAESLANINAANPVMDAIVLPDILNHSLGSEISKQFINNEVVKTLIQIILSNLFWQLLISQNNREQWDDSNLVLREKLISGFFLNSYVSVLLNICFTNPEVLEIKFPRDRVRVVKVGSLQFGKIGVPVASSVKSGKLGRSLQFGKIGVIKVQMDDESITQVPVDQLELVAKEDHPYFKTCSNCNEYLREFYDKSFMLYTRHVSGIDKMERCLQQILSPVRQNNKKKEILRVAYKASMEQLITVPSYITCTDLLDECYAQSNQTDLNTSVFQHEPIISCWKAELLRIAEDTSLQLMNGPDGPSQKLTILDSRYNLSPSCIVITSTLGMKLQKDIVDANGAVKCLTGVNGKPICLMTIVINLSELIYNLSNLNEVNLHKLSDPTTVERYIANKVLVSLYLNYTHIHTKLLSDGFKPAESYIDDFDINIDRYSSFEFHYEKFMDCVMYKDEFEKLRNNTAVKSAIAAYQLNKRGKEMTENTINLIKLKQQQMRAFVEIDCWEMLYKSNSPASSPLSSPMRCDTSAITPMTSDTSVRTPMTSDTSVRTPAQRAFMQGAQAFIQNLNQRKQRKIKLKNQMLNKMLNKFEFGGLQPDELKELALLYKFK